MGTGEELPKAVVARYRAATRAEKGRILTEFTEIFGYHRTHAERLLRRGHVVDRSRPRPGRRVYDQAVRDALMVLWEASDRICGKRQKPLPPLLVPAMERYGHLALERWCGSGCSRSAQRRLKPASRTGPGRRFG